MAIRIGVRIKPEPGRSALETTIQDPDYSGPAGTATGGMVRVLQLVGWDDAKFPLANYEPGMPETERHLVIIDQHVVTMDIAAFAGKSIAQARAMWEQAFAPKVAEWTAAKPTLTIAAAGAAAVEPILL